MIDIYCIVITGHTGGTSFNIVISGMQQQPVSLGKRRKDAIELIQGNDILVAEILCSEFVLHESRYKDFRPFIW